MKTKIPKPKKLPSGSWRIQVMVEGKRVSRTFDRPEEAIAWAASVKAGIEEAKKAPKAITLYDAFDRYIEERTAVLSPATVRTYRTIQKHRYQGLMRKNIYSTTSSDVQRAISEEMREVTPHTVRTTFLRLKSIYTAYGVTFSNIKLPQVVKPQREYLQSHEIGPLIEALKGNYSEIPILLALWLGMRISEILGLCWDCVDIERSTITVRRALVSGPNGKRVMKQFPKNTSSQRTLRCPKYIMDKIEALPSREGRLFTMTQGTVYKGLQRACVKAGVTVTNIHGLRHTNAAIMVSLGIDEGLVMSRGGWSCPETYKKIYSYVFDSSASAADVAIDDYFTEKMHTNLHTEK